MNSKMVKSNLHAHRHSQEELTYQVDRFITHVYPAVSLSNKIKFRKRLISEGMTFDQAKGLAESVLNFSDSDVERMADFHAWGVPIEVAVNYVSAPNTGDASGVPVREQIYNGVKVNQDRSVLEGAISRLSYCGAFLAASTSVAFAGARFASLNSSLSFYVAPLNKIFDGIERALSVPANSIGSDVVGALAGPNTAISVSALIGLGLIGAAVQRHKARKKLPDLASKLTEPVAGQAQEIYGNNRSDRAWTRYQKLSEGHKHLLTHLSPYELRVVLTGGPQAAREVLTANPISYSQQIIAWAHESPRVLLFIGRAIEVSLPESMKKSVRNALLKRGIAQTELRPEEMVVQAVYDTGDKPTKTKASRVDVPTSIRPDRSGLLSRP